MLKSTTTIDQAEQLILDLFARFQVPQGEAVLCGNSVHVDRQFLCKEMPRIVEYLHYRIIDVSTVGESGDADAFR